LGRFYAEGADVQPGHYVVTTGPYAYVRHPLFLSYIHFALGLVGLVPAVTTLAALIYTWWDFRRAARADEELLGKMVPGYLAYTKQTPQFIPRLNKIFPKQETPNSKRGT
jgi:protein-S-isoprenylcysteine O-methyltransferase Ste14